MKTIRTDYLRQAPRARPPSPQRRQRRQVTGRARPNTYRPGVRRQGAAGHVMPRIRTIKPEAFQSELLARVSLAAERTFVGLTTQADDRGRFPDKPATINGLLWAERSERIPHSTAEAEAELGELADAEVICRYTGCDGRHYVHSLTWHEDQKIDRPSKSRLPRCPEHGTDEECGMHDGACPPRASSRALANHREPSRAFDSHQTGTKPEPCGKPAIEPSRALASPRESSSNSPDQQEPESSRILASPREDSMQDLGPRTFKTPPTPPAVQSPILVGLPDARPEEGERNSTKNAPRSDRRPSRRDPRHPARLVNALDPARAGRPPP